MNLAIAPTEAELVLAAAVSDLDAAFARFLRLDVANGDASVDTIRGYRSQLAAWVSWCLDNHIDARLATVNDVKRYREDLVALGRQATTYAPSLQDFIHLCSHKMSRTARIIILS